LIEVDGQIVPNYDATLVPFEEGDVVSVDVDARRLDVEVPQDELARLIRNLEEEMHEAAADLRFEYAARLRDEIHDLKRELKEVV